MAFCFSYFSHFVNFVKKVRHLLVLCYPQPIVYSFCYELFVIHIFFIIGNHRKPMHVLFKLKYHCIFNFKGGFFYTFLLYSLLVKKNRLIHGIVHVGCFFDIRTSIIVFVWFQLCHILELFHCTVLKNQLITKWIVIVRFSANSHICLHYMMQSKISLFICKIHRYLLFIKENQII